jgi:methionyl-tRNA formyltransferase
MRVAILTSSRRGSASMILPSLLGRDGIEVVAVLRSRGEMTAEQRSRHRLRKLRKLASIGPIGALNGVRMRRWFDVGARTSAEDIEMIAARAEVPFTEWSRFNAPDCQDYLRSLGCDLGLSLGNGYIPKSVFTIPRLGMLNVHHELLPAMRGAQSVIWQIYNGSSRTGFTIHRIDAGIDTGAIVRVVEMPILFGPTLAETVGRTYESLVRRSGEVLAEVLSGADLVSRASPQSHGASYTTPSLMQYLRMLRQHARLARQDRSGDHRG